MTSGEVLDPSGPQFPSGTDESRSQQPMGWGGTGGGSSRCLDVHQRVVPAALVINLLKLSGSSRQCQFCLKMSPFPRISTDKTTSGEAGTRRIRLAGGQLPGPCCPLVAHSGSSACLCSPRSRSSSRVPRPENEACDPSRATPPSLSPLHFSHPF